MTFDRYIVIRNPASTDAHKTDRFISQLQKIAPKQHITVIDTSAGGQGANSRILLKHKAHLGERTLVCVGGGDGTTNLVLTILLNDPGMTGEARRSPILPLWAGNANDLAYMLNGSPLRTSLRSILARGRIVAVYPLICTLAFADGKTVTKVASNYASFGASGFAIKKLEHSLRTRSPMRQFAISRFGLEFVEVTRLLLRAPHFRIEENGQERLVFERVFLKGSRFAKIAAVPLKLTEKRFHRATVNRRNLATIIFELTELMRDRAGRRVGSVHDAFTVLDKVWAQFDGEPVRVPAGTHVDVMLSGSPFYALSTVQK